MCIKSSQETCIAIQKSRRLKTLLIEIQCKIFIPMRYLLFFFFFSINNAAIHNTLPERCNPFQYNNHRRSERHHCFLLCFLSRNSQQKKQLPLSKARETISNHHEQKPSEAQNVFITFKRNQQFIKASESRLASSTNATNTNLSMNCSYLIFFIVERVPFRIVANLEQS